MHTQAYLENYAVLQTTDLSEARTVVSEKYCDHRLDLVRGDTLTMRYHHVRGRDSSLNVLEYGADVRIDPGELQNFYLLQIPVSGKARIRHRGETVEADRWTGSILNPDRPTDMEWSADCRKVMLQIDADFLNRYAREDLGFDLPGPVRFDPKVDLTRAAGLSLHRTIMSTLQAYEKGSLVPQCHSLNEINLERTLAATLLNLQPSNVSHYFEDFQKTFTSRQVKKAVEFIQTEYHREVSLRDISVASGMHPRTLQTSFQDCFGISPMKYLKLVRLNAARYWLSRRHNRDTVTDVAYGCGFTHLGRFARDYRCRFGQSPGTPV